MLSWFKSIKILLDSINNFGKDLETIFKEGEDEDVKKVDYGTNPTYFMTKVKSGVLTKPEDLDLYPVNVANKIDNAFNFLEPENYIIIQLFKISADVDKEDLLSHVKEEGECYNTPGEPRKTEVPAYYYYSTEIQADNSKKPTETLI